MLLQAATGAGKTIMFSELIRRFMAQYHMRVGIVAHREILVTQARDKLMQVWPQGWHQVGLACTGASSRVDLERPVVIGSPQTLANRLGDMPPLDLLIIDEAHRLAPRNVKSQYRTLISRLLDYRPNMRVLGVTATPYRLGHGYIYGQRCKPGTVNWFPRLHFQVSIADLVAQGHLSHYRALEAADMDRALAGVDKSKGEFSLDQLGDLMAREVHIRSAVDAYRKWGEGRRHVVVFCVTIAHATRVRDAFAAAGYTAGLVHSEMPRQERRTALAAFEAGKLQVMANVGVLTEGWDATAVDCLLLCRPTMSPALYVQIVGRGLRKHPGKDDCLILDLSGNCKRHGDPSDPVVTVPQAKAAAKKEDLEDRFKACPECAHLVAPTAKACPYCGYAWPVEVLVDAGAPRDMKEVAWGAKPVKVARWRLYPHTSLRGQTMLRLEMECYNGGRLPLMVNQYLDFEGRSGLWARSKARDLWLTLAGSPPPTAMHEALERQAELQVPQEITVQPKGKFFNVVRWSA